jgi:DNA-binding transcriptional ArsR family regulator
MAVFDAAAFPPFIRLVGHPLRWRLVTELARSDLRVRELVGLVAEPQNLVSYHLRVLRSGGLVSATQQLRRAGQLSTPGPRPVRRGTDQHWRGAASGAADEPDALALAEDVAKPSVLFVCTGNSARSPMAEAMVRQATLRLARRAVQGHTGRVGEPATRFG